MVTIYALNCLATGKAYIGCTRAKLSKRFREHRSILNAGTHSSKLLQADWTLHGEKMFTMEALLHVEEDSSLHVLRGMEKYAMQRYKDAGLLYNENMASFEPSVKGMAQGRLNIANAPIGNRWSEEANRKRSLSQKGIPKNHGAKISATKRARRAMR